MAGKLFYIEGSAADGTYEADETTWSSKQYSECELAYIKFFDGAGTVVTPTAGILKLQFSPEGTVWRNGQDHLINAAEVYDEDVIMTYAAGMIHVARIIITGLTGSAVTFSACYWRPSHGV